MAKLIKLSTFKICTSTFYLHKKRAFRGGERGGLTAEPWAGRSVSDLEFSNFYFLCVFTLSSIYGGDPDFPFVVVG